MGYADFNKRVYSSVFIGIVMIFAVFTPGDMVFRVFLTFCALMAAFEIVSGVTTIYDDAVIDAYKQRNNGMMMPSPHGGIFVVLEAIFCCITPVFYVWLIDDKWYLLMIFLVCMTSDASGYLVGKFIGKNTVPGIRKISPHKTIEGYLGSLLFSIAAGVLLYMFLPIERSFAQAVFVCFGGLIACTGDLLGSVTKRELGLDDSNAVTLHLPGIKWLEWPMAGHGGYLDRFDSIIFAVVVCALLQLFL